MSYRKKVKLDSTEAAAVQFQNLFAQLVSLVGARKTYCELGRGSAKTTDVQCERLVDVMYDMPGAPCAWVADTFQNLTTNILPSVLEGLERKGFREGVHFVIEKEPPSFTDAEKADLPDWLRPHFWKPFNHLVSYKRTMVFFTGLNIRFGSLDRPSTLAGASYVFVFGDETKYFREEKIANLLKAVRGYRLEYGDSVFYRGVSFTSDVADPSHIGEYDWMQKNAAAMDIDAVLLVMHAGMVYNEALQEYVAAKDRWLRTKDMADLTECRNKLRIANLWRERWVKLRKMPSADTFYIRASSYVNADILTPEWFADAISGQLSDVKTAILSMRPELDSGARFYTALDERHFYYDGIDETAAERFGLLEEEDCTVLRYLDRGRLLKLGVDFGNMCSMCIAQDDYREGHNVLRVLKFLYTLPPDYVEDLGRKFRKFFAAHRNRVVQLYYDRAGNTYKDVKEDQVSKLKHSIEYDEQGRRTGWAVSLMSLNQGNIPQNEEYHFMQEMLGERNPRLPVVKIDAYAAKPLKLSLQLARTKVKNGVVYKDKSSERLPADQLPTKSTNPSDAFKYLLMTKENRRIFRSRPAGSTLLADPMIK